MLQNMIFHHLGIATGDIDKTAYFYKETGYKKTETIYDSIQNVKICFLKKESTPLIELVEPFNEKSPVSKIIQKSGVSPYHTCYEVKDIYEYIKVLKRFKFIPLFKPVPAIALENRLICFLYHKDYGLIELLQSNTNS